MNPVKAASAGVIKSGDAVITVEPGNGNLEITIASKVTAMFGRQIRNTVEDVLKQYDVTSAKVKVDDRMALDYAIRARLECALFRSFGDDAVYPWKAAPTIATRKKPVRFRLRRSMMFLSAQKISQLQDPGIYGEDSLIIDLEDAVAVGEKDAARLSMYHAVSGNRYGNLEVVVRINGLTTPFWREDVRACVAAGVDAIRIPKCETVADVRAVEAAIEEDEKALGICVGRTLIMAALESPLGIINAYPIACCSERLLGITVSGGDLRRTLQARTTASGIELLYARQAVVYAARAAGVQCFDTVFVNLEDMDGFARETQMIRDMGFDGKSIVNPKQIETVHNIFTPTSKEIEGAAELIHALKEQRDKGVGVFVINGKMFDIANLPGAERTIELAKACGVYKEDL